MKIPFGFYPISTGHYDPRLPDIVIKKWYKKIGDTTGKGEPILLLETDKVEMDLISPVSGRIGKIYEEYRKEGSPWKSGDAEKLADGRILYHPFLGVIETEDVEKAESDNRVLPDAEVKEEPLETQRIVITQTIQQRARKEGILQEDLTAFAQREGIRRMGPLGFDRFLAWRKSQEKETPATEAEGGIRAVQAARTLAREKGVDLTLVKGNGDYGTIILGDVVTHLADLQHVEKQEAVPEGDRLALNASQIRKTVARMMTLSHQKIPKAGDAVRVNVTQLQGCLKQCNEILPLYDGIKLRYEHFLMYICAKLLSLDEFKIINAYWDEETQDGYLFKNVNIGVAVQTSVGLMIPVIHHAQTLSFKELMQSAEDKIRRAHARKITLPELRDLTFTVNNVGALGGELPDSIIPYTVESSGKERPTGMILALGRATQSPNDWPWYANLAFKFDHRLFDGAPGIRFVRTIKDYIESKQKPLEFLELFKPDFSLNV